LVVPVLVACAACSSTPPLPTEHQTVAHALYERAADHELRLVNANTWLVPVHAKRHRQRLEALSSFVHSLPEAPDVITLQEVWQAKRVAQVSELFPGYTAYTSGRHRRLLGLKINESGLVTLVHRGIEVTRFDYALIDREQLVSYNRIVGKGALALEVRCRGHGYRIVNVHLPNTFGGRHTRTTQEALASLRLDGVVAGDLNLEPHELPAGLVVDDLTPTFGNDGLGRERTRRIDYVFGDESTAVESVVVTDVRGRCLPVSDHCVLAARLWPRALRDAAQRTADAGTARAAGAVPVSLALALP
jgi:endonuclease/exonuclease/phosphatase family metal-dependent hydrolase